MYDFTVPPSTPVLYRYSNEVVDVISANEGEQINITCISTGNPNPTPADYAWFKGTVAVTSGTSLVITSLGSDDVGVYICKVQTLLSPTGYESEMFSSQTSVTVNVLCKYILGLLSCAQLQKKPTPYCYIS